MQTVTVTFHELDIESSIRCSYDYVALYNGRDTKAPLVGRYCGSRGPQPLTSSSSVVFIVFESDVDENAGRFTLSWKFNEGQSSILGVISGIINGDNTCPHLFPNIKQESRVVGRKETVRCRSCCFWFKVRRQHLLQVYKSSQASKTRRQSSKRTGAKTEFNAKWSF